MTIQAVVIALLIIGSNLYGFQLPSSRTAPEEVVNRFESHGESALQTLVNFGRVTNTPIGIVISDRALCEQKVDVISNGESAAVVTAEILSTVPAYKWSVQGEVVVVEPRAPVGPLAQLLQISIPRFATPGGILQAQNIDLWMFTHALLIPVGGTGASVLSSPDQQRADAIEMNHVSVVDVLNRIISRKPKGLWIIPPLTEPLESAIQQPVSEVMTYGEPLAPGPDRFASCEPIR